MLHAWNSTSNASIVAEYDRTKTIVETTSLSNYNPSILAIHFEGKSPNLMTVDFSRYTVCLILKVVYLLL